MYHVPGKAPLANEPVAIKALSPLMNERGVIHSQTYACDAVATDKISIVVVPQTVHDPFIAGLPFFIVTGFGSFCSVFFLHFTQ
jgi:hypothetical protein